MIWIIGTAKEISDVVHDIAPEYPADKLRELTPGEWLYRRAEVNIKMTVIEGKKTNE